MKVTFQSADKADSPCSVIGLTCWVRLPVVRRYSIIGILLHGMQLFSVMPTHDKKTRFVASCSIHHQGVEGLNPRPAICPGNFTETEAAACILCGMCQYVSF